MQQSISSGTTTVRVPGNHYVTRNHGYPAAWLGLLCLASLVYAQNLLAQLTNLLVVST